MFPIYILFYLNVDIDFSDVMEVNNRLGRLFS